MTMNEFVLDPDAVDAMLEGVVPASEGGRLTKPGAVVRNPLRAIRQHANLATRRINKLNIEQVESLLASSAHLQQFDEWIQQLGNSDGIGAKRSAIRLILAREKMAHTLMMDQMEKNVRIIEAGDGAAGSGDVNGLTPEQAIRLLAEGAHVKVSETKTERRLEAQVD